MRPPRWPCRKTNRTTDMQLVHLASRLYGTPLLIARPKLDVILSVLGSRIGLPDLDMAMPLPMPRQKRHIGSGWHCRHPGGRHAGQTFDGYRSRLWPDVLRRDRSPTGRRAGRPTGGGHPARSGFARRRGLGCVELAERIRAASTIKPIWAHANDAAYSAAFAIAAACQRLTLSQTAGVGSIGVIALHVDQSVKDAKDGLNCTPLSSRAATRTISPARATHPPGHHRVCRPRWIASTTSS